MAKGQTVQLPLTILSKGLVPSKDPIPKRAGGAGRPLTEFQQNLRDMLANVGLGETFKLPARGEELQTALMRNLRTAAYARDAGIKFHCDDTHVWFELKNKTVRKPADK